MTRIPLHETPSGLTLPGGQAATRPTREQLIHQARAQTLGSIAQVVFCELAVRDLGLEDGRQRGGRRCAEEALEYAAAFVAAVESRSGPPADE